MIVAADIYDSSGNRLITSETILTDALINILKRRNIKQLFISREERLSPVEIAEQQQAIKVKLAQRFRKVLDHPDMLRLHDILLTWRMENFIHHKTNERK